MKVCKRESVCGEHVLFIYVIEFLVAMTDRRGGDKGSSKSNRYSSKSINSDSPLPEGSSDNGSSNGMKSPSRAKSVEDGITLSPPPLDIKCPPRAESPLIMGTSAGVPSGGGSKRTPQSIKKGKDKGNHGSVYVEDHEMHETLPGTSNGYIQLPGNEYPGTATSQLINHAHTAGSYAHSIKRVKSNERGHGNIPIDGLTINTQTPYDVPPTLIPVKSTSYIDISHGNEVEFGHFEHPTQPLKSLPEFTLTPKKPPNKIKLQSLGGNNPSNDLVGGFIPSTDSINYSPRDNRDRGNPDRIAIYSGNGMESYYPGMRMDTISNQESKSTDEHLAAAETVGE